MNVVTERDLAVWYLMGLGGEGIDLSEPSLFRRLGKSCKNDTASWNEKSVPRYYSERGLSYF